MRRRRRARRCRRPATASARHGSRRFGLGLHWRAGDGADAAFDQRRQFRRALEFALNRRAPCTPDIDIRLAQALRDRLSWMLSQAAADSPSAAAATSSPARDQVQQYRCAPLRRQPGDAGQQRVRLRLRRVAQRRRGQQQAPVLLRPLRQRPPPGLGGEDPRHCRQRAARLVARPYLAANRRARFVRRAGTRRRLPETAERERVIAGVAAQRNLSRASRR